MSYIVQNKNDWCHLCGERDEMIFAEFFLPENAERSLEKKNGRFVRLCKGCVDLLSFDADRAAGMKDKTINRLKTPVSKGPNLFQ